MANTEENIVVLSAGAHRTTDINKLINCEIIGVDRLPSILERGGRC